MRLAAAGNLGWLGEPLRSAFSASPAFEPLAAPLPDDWLANHFEGGQTFEQYVRSRPNRPTEARRTIYVVPIGDLAGRDAPPLDLLVEFTRAHFQLPVMALRPIALAALNVRSRGLGAARQLLAPDVLQKLEEILPADAYCLIGLTAVDLYPDDSWNFVFGMASFRERVGIYSIARYSPSFYGAEDHYPMPERWVMRRALKVMAHEIGHMFGMEHCIHYECVMNGSNNLEETDRRPPHLCPVCLHKLHYAARFDPVRRYRDLAGAFKRAGLGPESEWTRARADELAAVNRPPP